MAFKMEGSTMKAYTYIKKGRFELIDKPKSQVVDPKDAGDICRDVGDNGGKWIVFK